jgi:hypothetical protein
LALAVNKLTNVRKSVEQARILENKIIEFKSDRFFQGQREWIFDCFRDELLGGKTRKATD